jgi:hypothetical protein
MPARDFAIGANREREAARATDHMGWIGITLAKPTNVKRSADQASYAVRALSL